eukprot:Tamp_12795.p1 GENE.Tamp_12795~~Tamp_12795.p1  ORF type:complete len:357 (+),score=74.35 Tamp_12795:197-1267(+)
MEHMAPCVCHCAACGAAGHGRGACIVLRARFLELLEGKADIVELILRHYYEACRQSCDCSTAQLGESIYCVRYSPSGDVLAAGSAIGRMHLICAQTGKTVSSVSAHTRPVEELSFHPAGETLATCSKDGTVRLWDVSSGKKHSELSVGGEVCSSAYSPDGSQIAAVCNHVGASSGCVKILNPETGAELCTLHGHTDKVLGLSFHPEGKILASCSNDKTVRLWDVTSGEELSALTGHTDFVCSVAYSPDGTQLASGSRDKTVRLWDPGVQLTLDMREKQLAFAMAWHARLGAASAASCFDQHVFQLILDRKRAPRALSELNLGSSVAAIQFSPSGDTIAAGCGRGMRLIDVAAWKVK